MRPALLIFAFALLITSAVIPAVAPASAETPEMASAPAAQVLLAVEDLPTPSVAVDPLLGETCVASPEAAAVPPPPSYCPYGAPSCTEHDDCDAYCGSPEFGYCDKLGYFPTGCCQCLG